MEISSLAQSLASPPKNARAQSFLSNNGVNTKKKFEVDQVGFSSLPEQVHRKSLKKGFEFTLLVVGDSGLGKSTLVNSLFMTNLYAEKSQIGQLGNKTAAITSRTCELEEKGVRLKLTVVDTPGFGEAINSQNCWKLIEDYIDKQFNSFYIHESGYGIERKKSQDTRVHCCLYFIPSYVRGLRPIDIETMKSLQSRVNIVPVISKADSLTKKELETLKRNVLNDIEKYNVKIYEFPLCDSDDDDTFKKVDNEIKNAIPFGIIGSNTIIECGQKRVRGRVYPWGIVDIESDTACDFNKLRTFLCSSHMQDLKDLTHDVHYENYRTEFIKSSKLGESSSESSVTVNGSNRSSQQVMKDDADKLLKQKDIELRKMQDLIEKMKTNMTANGHQNSNYQTFTQNHVNSMGSSSSSSTGSGSGSALVSFGNIQNRINSQPAGQVQVQQQSTSTISRQTFIVPSNQTLNRISGNNNYYDTNQQQRQNIAINNAANNYNSYLTNSTSI